MVGEDDVRDGRAGENLIRPRSGMGWRLEMRGRIVCRLEGVFLAMTKNFVKFSSSSWMPMCNRSIPRNKVPQTSGPIAAEYRYFSSLLISLTAAEVEVVLIRAADGMRVVKKLLHCPNACSWLNASCTSSSFVPDLTKRQCWMLKTVSPTIVHSLPSSPLRSWSYVSATGPKVEFSWGTTIAWEVLFRAPNASRMVEQGR